MSKQIEIDFIYDSWAEKLSLEIGIMLMPVVDSRYNKKATQRLAARIAMLASRRARDAGKLVDPEPTGVVSCQGCDRQMMIGIATYFCAVCAKGVKTPGSEG